MFRTLLLLALFALPALADVEEDRLPKAEAAMPGLLAPFAPLLAKLDDKASLDTVTAVASQGWALGKSLARQKLDDRPLYWFRLAGKAKLRALALPQEQKAALLRRFEAVSRGIDDVQFTGPEKHILLTGFDPFFLDRHIDQSNPSGLAALLLDGQVIEKDGVRARIETVLIPVRFKDFDDGLIERLLLPYYSQKTADMVVTVSMGREDFDLERYPGKRRSAEAPDNLNVMTGATAVLPKLPLLYGKPLSGPEFVTFSLPAAAMAATSGPFPIHDNRKVATLDGDLEALHLSEIQSQVSVRGSGGGYLSNEISYRAIRLRNLMKSPIPVGHIHVPRINAYDKAKEKASCDQLKAMLENALVALK
ncbi:hypothetical protein PVT67_18260 [Gallaecimonas kandeliae]|uniref:hypothetical protein n=1 Tax=Gallaecimonas kandeliae TaxID=3029055 RepID=UPI002649EB04|nr:hypothetical protein [Gallaecimonas kandeliae]WKE65581.1 hypothetical protein PVT67_18260 [Gallaecimonas kandeliae]